MLEVSTIAKMTFNCDGNGKNDDVSVRTGQEEVGDNKTNQYNKDKERFFFYAFVSILPSVFELKQYAGVLMCGLTLWGATWFVIQDVVLPGSPFFQMTVIVIVGYVAGHTLERYTKISAMVGMTLVGALYRNLVPINFLEDPVINKIDFHLRRVYPVIILTKGPLGWNWPYIKNNSVKVFLLATLPWIAECLSTTFFTHLLLEYPWYWGLHLGAILSSVSPAVVVPTVMAFNARGYGTKNKIALLVANAGGLDTAFTEGVFGVINAAIFNSSVPSYRIIKAIVAIFLGIGLGIAWGVLSDVVPDQKDPFAAAIRSIFIFTGGLLITYAGGYTGWGGTSGVAIMVCATTASTRWSRRDWPINNNPVTTVYKVLWLIFEPMLFTLSGYFLEVSQMTLREFGLIIACLFMALLVRLVCAFLIALANKFSWRESLFVAVTWIPKAIVEAVLVRVATDSLWQDGASEQDKKIAKQHANIIVVAILTMTTIGSVLTTILGPVLLSKDSKVSENDKAVKDRDKGIFIVPQQEEFKTVHDLTQIEPVTKSGRGDDCVKKKAWCASIKLNILHNLTLSIVGFISWGLLWCAFGDDWRWDGQWFRLAAVAVVAWASGQILEKLTTLPPLLGALLIGIFARYFGVLDMRHYHQVDSFLRKIYPVIILGKGSLAWDVNYMKNNWKQVAALGTLPWAVEVAITALCTHYLLAFPWVWGLLLGSIYASVSFAVVMPLVQRHGAGPERSRNWPQLICTAGGIDTALSVGVYGLIHSFIFTNTIDVYRYTKAALTLFAGVALGVIWGSLAKFVPHSSDFYVTELRVMFVLVGGLFANFFTSAIGWGGTGGVAVLVCNATAATHWAQNGWKLNKNPASTVYKVLWSVLEPMLFAYTGTFFVMHNNMVHTMYVGLAILVITLTARLITTTLVCWNFSIKEKLFVCCTWISKSIVEAVLCPLAIITLMSNTSSNEHDIRYAEDLMRLIIQAILITTPIGFLLTNFLAPIFLSRKSSSQDTESQQRKSRD